MKNDGILTFVWMKDGWNSLLDNLHNILPAMLAFQVLAVAPSLLIWKHFDSRWYALPWEVFVGVPLAVGMNLFFINLVRRGRVDYGDLFRGFTVFPQAVIVSLAYGFMVTAGVIMIALPGKLFPQTTGFSLLYVLLAAMLIIPGIVWALAYIFAQYSVLDRRSGIKGSFTYSSRITYGFKEKLLPIGVLWLMLEILAPGIVTADGSVFQMRLILDLKPWVITAFILKTFIFLPWLDMVMAQAYVSLVKHNDRQERDAKTAIENAA